MKHFKEELALLYDQYGYQLYVCALAVLGNGGLAEDAVHDAFCQAMAKPRNPGDLRAYMFRSVRNAAIDIKRRTNRHIQWTTETVGQIETSVIAHDSETKEYFQLVLDAMTQVKDIEREIVLAHLIGGLKFREIAETSELPMGTVTAHYHRAMTKLRGLLEKYHGSI